MEASFLVLSILHCIVRRLRCVKISDLFCRTLSQTLHLKTLPRQVETLRRSSLLTTPTTVDASQARGWAHEVYHTSVDRNALTPLFRFMVDLVCNLFLQGVQQLKKSRLAARRAVPLWSRASCSFHYERSIKDTNNPGR